MDEVLSQAPADISHEVIKKVFEKHEKNVLATLMELWNIEEKQKDKTKWEEIRDTCDAFDTEMQDILQCARRHAKAQHQ